MKRKTNLFYTTGESSKYLTFSNYTESLTGNFLSVDTKLFPSRFLCLNIKGLTGESKQYLIKYLVSYYENKMAILRDECIEQDINYEKKILPLAYLIESLLKIEKLTNEEIIVRDDCYVNSIEVEPIFDIPYVGDVTEQDYNGTFADTICIVSMNNMYSGKITKKNSKDINSYIDSPSDTLYGWNRAELNDIYSRIQPKYDKQDEQQYSFDTYLNEIELVKEKNPSRIEFNCIIPLYDVVDINYNTTSSIIQEYNEIQDDNNEVNLVKLPIKMRYINKNNEQNIPAIKDVPLGIWLSENPIVLEREVSTGYCPSWSLVISQQFKPFPYSKNYDYKLDATNTDAFNTFAIILSKQNDMINSFNKISTQLQNLQSQINEIRSELKNKATLPNIDKLQLDIINYKKTLGIELEEYKNKIDSYFTNFKWQATV